MKKKILIDNFFNYKTQYKVEEHFNRSFIDHFGIVPDGSIKFFPRYASGFITYHSLSYTNRKILQVIMLLLKLWINQMRNDHQQQKPSFSSNSTIKSLFFLEN